MVYGQCNEPTAGIPPRLHTGTELNMYKVSHQAQHQVVSPCTSRVSYVAQQHSPCIMLSKRPLGLGTSTNRSINKQGTSEHIASPKTRAVDSFFRLTRSVCRVQREWRHIYHRMAIVQLLAMRPQPRQHRPASPPSNRERPQLHRKKKTIYQAKHSRKQSN